MTLKSTVPKSKQINSCLTIKIKKAPKTRNRRDLKLKKRKIKVGALDSEGVCPVGALFHIRTSSQLILNTRYP